MRVLVVGGTGQVGSRVAAGLVDLGAEVRVLTRDARRAMPPGQVAVQGDLFDVPTLRAELAAADAMFLMSPPSEAITFAGLTVLAVAQEAQVGHVVMMTGQDCELHRASGHIGSLVVLEQVLAASGLCHTLLNPNYFFQNDVRQKQALLAGVYGTPLGDVGLSRCDARDIADAALAALQRPGHWGRLRICGPEVLTGEACAQAWALALGRPVQYGGHADMAAIEQRWVQAGTPPHWALDIRLMYESFQRHGLLATAQDVDRLSDALGRAPRRFGDFAAETAQEWAAV